MVDGKNIWEKHRSEMEFVIAHPNGWGIRQQTFLREAAAVAGLSAYSPSRNNIRFVTEAEASVHFCIYHTNLGSRLQTNTTFAVCDAGGSTVDTTVYSVMAARPILRIREVKSSACVQAGAIFVDAAAEKYLRAVFTEASLPYEDIDDYTARGVKDFEHSVKRNFCDSAGDQAVEITGSRINHPSIGIQSGRMALSESVVESFFEDCVNEITASVDDQIKETNVSYMLLVGGFGDSPFLLQRFRTRYEPRGCQVTQLANNSMSKAVADGAIIWNNMSSVVGRAPRSSFGTQTTEPYDPSCPQHRGRGVYTCPSGYDRVIGHWSQIVEKGVVIDARAEARESFHRNYSFPDPHLECFETVLYSYPGVGIPRLYDGFQKSCTVRADLTNLSGMLEPKTGHNGRKYWRLDYHICIRFGGTELEAYIEWENDGTMYRGEAAIIPE
ncbi:hypothetical protein FRC09_013911 [Ceratobasidium sp. 395]|nr:hypothetical protein FRC09_013911 [Ceratobasidium sp. 395]